MNNDIMAKRISFVLVTGVIISSICIIIGIILSIINNDFTYDLEHYDFKILKYDLINFDARAFLMLGIFILILTPIIRVFCMLIQYYIEKNYTYISICFIILIVLAISLFLGATHL
ncbi:DUF1634 domain-containing protein [Gemella sp. GH3]|uniref:DUF1634 domain-containing protein n=1 Tax=unclassified Gemella TaxID=2624949 RepID=UPI0015CFD6FE|nr:MULTISPECIES: DUF1634 domain-containing protein [unclassified Gemella]MBF0713242.1 DUF1634 domain-containing protein [Gemella sp. GH3.1]NYS50194.1 DUF1634 domain-containing protein [Gemella sp. GH3]